MATLESLEEAILHLQYKNDRIGKRVVKIENSTKHVPSTMSQMFLVVLGIGYLGMGLSFRYGGFRLEIPRGPLRMRGCAKGTLCLDYSALRTFRF